MEAQIKNLASVREFLLAGSALFTVKSKLTSDHRTYLVERPEPTQEHPVPTWFVKLLTGPDTYQYIGFLRCTSEGEITFVLGRNVGATSPAVLGFKWLIGILNNLVEPLVAANFDRCATFMHAGRCGRCRRPLTNPESIETGIGPVCAEKD